jgi:hypothetical protein
MLYNKLDDKIGANFGFANSGCDEILSIYYEYCDPNLWKLTVDLMDSLDMGLYHLMTHKWK